MTADGETLKDKFQKTKKVRRAWSLYKWFDRIRNWQDWYTWLSSLLQTPAGAVAALGTTAAVTTSAILVHNVVVDPYAEPYVPTEVAPLAASEPMRQTKGTLIFAIEGRDSGGRRGMFDVVVARKQFLWVRGSSDQLEKDGRVISNEQLASEVLDPDVRAGLDGAREIVAVGTASQEGNAAEEKARAGRRAAKTAEIIGAEISASIPISSLNLGQYRGSRAQGGTDWQRPFMVIAVKDLEQGTVLAEALADAMTGKEQLPSPASYSAFELTKIR